MKNKRNKHTQEKPVKKQTKKININMNWIFHFKFKIYKKKTLIKNCNGNDDFMRKFKHKIINTGKCMYFKGMESQWGKKKQIIFFPY